MYIKYTSKHFGGCEMANINRRKNVLNKKNESVEDPHELLLSLVDLGSLDAEEALLACVTEMSDAECKRVLGSLSLPNCCDEVDDEMSVEVDDIDDANTDVEFPSDEEEPEDEDAEEVEFEDEDAEDEDDTEAELEARIRRLENSLRTESKNRNRSRRVSRRETNC